jgi:hypothetical protein
MEWYYIAEEGRAGPFEDAEMAQQIAGGTVHRGTEVWAQGMPEWRKASTTQLAGYFVSPPPLPARRLNTYVWWMVLGPYLVSFVVESLLGGDTGISLFTAYLAMVAFGVWDAQALDRAGLERPNMGWVVVLPPVYLWERARRLGQRPTYFWVSVLLCPVLPVLLVVGNALGY